MKPKLKLNSILVNRLILVFIALLFIGALFSTDEIIGLLGNNSNKLVSLKAQKQALQREQIYLIGAKKEIKKYSGLEQIAKAIVPQDKDQALAVREIVNMAQVNNITLSSITFPSSDLGTATTTPASATSTLSLSQLTPVKGISGVYILPIQVSDSQKNYAVSYSNFYNFLTQVQQNRRTSLVTGLNITPLPDGLINFNITINEYIKPL